MLMCPPIALCCLPLLALQATPSADLEPGTAANAAQFAQSTTLAFVENRGQWKTSARYVGRVGAVNVLVEPDAIGLQLSEPGRPERGAFVRIRFVNPSPDCRIEPQVRLAGIESFFLGNDPAHWATGLPRWGGLRLTCAWNGVDIVLRESGGQLEYDVEVAPGVDLDVVRFEVEGGGPLILDGERLGLSTAVGILWQRIPACWQQDARGVRKSIEGLWLPFGPSRFGLHAPERDVKQALVVDPQIAWGTYVGSVTGEDTPIGLARTPSGDLVVAGHAAWTMAFPQTPGAYQHPSGTIFGNVVVFRVEGSTGALVYSSVIGGSSGAAAWAGVALDQWGAPIVAGQTRSTDFPTTTGAFDPIMNALDTAAFVLRLSPMGDQLIYSTYLEAPAAFQGGLAQGVAATADGSAVVVGIAYDASFPTTPGAFDTTYNGNEDAFVLRLDPTGSTLEWSTFLGGPLLWDAAHAVAIGSSGAVTVVGYTGDASFPVTPGSYSTVPPGPQTQRQAFVTRLTPAGDALEWSTFLGGSQDDRAFSVALDADGGVIVGGETLSPNFPVTPGVAQAALHPSASQNQFVDGFVARLDSTGSQLVYGTYLGGTPNYEAPFGLAVDASGVATVTGRSGATTGFPETPGAYNWNPPVTYDFYLTRLGPRGELLYSTFVGSPLAEDWGADVVRAPDGRITVVGHTIGPGFPTTPGAFGPSYFGGGRDITLAQLDLLYEGESVLGASTRSCRGPLEAKAAQWPLSGTPDFALWCSQAPPMSTGFLLLGTAASTPIQVAGVALWLEPNRPIKRIPITSDGFGWVRTNVDLTGVPPGKRFAGQFLIRNTPVCGAQGWCSSNAVAITVQ